MDTVKVQNGEVSEGIISPVEPSQPKPLTQEQIQQMLNEHTEVLRRQLQSEKDKAIAEVRREAEKRIRRAEIENATIKSSLKQYDPETGDINQTLELAELRSRDTFHRDYEQQEKARQDAESFNSAFQESLTSLLTEMGVDPNDKRIDWAQNATTYLDMRKRFDKSVAKIQKEERSKVRDTIKEELLQEIRKEMGLDTHDKGASKGGVLSDAAFKKGWADGDLPSTKANVERINKLLKE